MLRATNWHLWSAPQNNSAASNRQWLRHRHKLGHGHRHGVELNLFYPAAAAHEGFFAVTLPDLEGRGVGLYLGVGIGPP